MRSISLRWRRSCGKKKELDSVGGLPYLASLSEGLPRKLSIESYVRIVRDKSLMRQLMTVCDMGMVEAADQSRRRSMC